ncbi:hypothetical protein, partial [Ideonella sp.]|uniref:hypothetical protein n=1 Tax=Ideonella sp. TaxID=1929293 RepID=UPI003BB696A7
VGYSNLADNVMSRAFVGKVGSKKVTELAVPAGKSAAYAINKLGVIVGRYTRASDGKYAPFSCSGACADFLDLNTVTTGLPAGVELRSALAINDKGMVTAQGSDNRIYLLLPQ